MDTWPQTALAVILTLINIGLVMWVFRYFRSVMQEVSPDIGKEPGFLPGLDILARYEPSYSDDVLLLRRGSRRLPPVQVRGVRCGWSMLWLTLDDGRVIGAPLARFPQLAVATWRQRRRWQIRGDGSIVVWSELELQVSARALLGHES